MNKIYYLLSLLLALPLSSCNDWLDVNPRSQIKSEVLFETEDGFKQAVNGVYIRLAQTDLFGKNANMYIPETMARMWSVPLQNSNLSMYSIANYDFTESGAEDINNKTLSAYYNAIAQCNDILENLDNTSVKFTNGNDRLIRGELTGLRAFLHLDILRLWGPYPDNATGSTTAIPYVTEMTNAVDKLRSKTWDEVVGLIEKDLNDAESILAEVDPYTYADADSLNRTSPSYYVGKGTMPKDEWQMQRRARFSYYAVLGTKARFYHWIGDTEDAVKYAKMVVDDEKFKLCTASTMTWTLVPEHLFGTDNINMLTDIETDFDSENASFTQAANAVNTAYETSAQPGDIRAGRYWKNKTYGNGVTTHVFCKYIGNEQTDSDYRVPLLRYAEMYLILIEDLPLAEAQTYFETYRLARGLSETMANSMFATESSRLAQLEKEWRKEFWGEGQMFAFYKKHHYTAFTWPSNVSLPENALIVPMPKGITNFE